MLLVIFSGFYSFFIPTVNAQINAGEVYLPDTTKPSVVNGTGEPGATITVRVFNNAAVVYTTTTTVDTQGEWRVALPAFDLPPTNITADSEIAWTPRKVVETATVTTAAATSGLVLLQLLAERFFRLLQFFGLLGHRKTKGYVFDAVTKKPVPFALLTIESIGQAGAKIQETVVSAVDGFFKTIALPPGKYTVTVAHPAFSFPVTSPRPWYVAPLEYYQGQPITVGSQKELEIIFIPMTPKEAGTRVNSYWLNLHVLGGLLSQAAKVLSVPMGIVSVLLVIIFPSFINFLVTSLYLLIGLQIVLRNFENKVLKGKIIDDKNKPIANAIIRVYRISPDELAAVTLSNTKGEFKLRLPKNQYRTLISKDGWIPLDNQGLSYETVDLNQTQKEMRYTMQAVTETSI